MFNILCYQPSKMNPSIVFQACLRGNIELIKKCQKRTKSTNAILKLRDAMGATCLHYAARVGNIQLLAALLNTTNSKISDQVLMAPKCALGSTPLHDAAILGHLEVVQWFVREAKWNVFETDFDGCNILHLAAR